MLMKRFLMGGAALLLGTALAFGQTAAPTQQVPARLDAAVLVSSTAPAVNATQATGTITITPPAGQYVYFTGLYFAACGDGTASQSSIQQSFTSTNLSGLTVETSYISGSTITTNAGASQCDRVTLPFSVPLKSAQAGLAVTLVPPAQAAHMSFPMVATYYFSN